MKRIFNYICRSGFRTAIFHLKKALRYLHLGKAVSLPREYKGIQAYSRRGNSGLIVPTVIKGNGIRLLNIPYKKAEIQIFDIVGRRVYRGILERSSEVPFKKVLHIDTERCWNRELIKLR